jgi:hypothetical protein
MNTICDTENFMSSVLNNLFCAHCLDNVAKNNQYYEDTKLSKTRDIKLYKSREAFEEEVSTEKMLLDVIVKIPDGDENLWARGAPQQLATISMAPRGAILLVRFELIGSRSLCKFPCDFYAFKHFGDGNIVHVLYILHRN